MTTPEELAEDAIRCSLTALPLLPVEAQDVLLENGMTTHITVRAAEVHVNDRIWSGSAIRGFEWARVREVTRCPDDRYIIIKTLGFTTWKHPDEAVAVQRSQ